MHTTLFEIFIFLATTCIAVPVASRLKLGSVLGYLIAGLAIGPHAFALINDAEGVMHFAEFGVIMMLFVIGLELEPAILWRMRKSIVGMGGLQVIGSSLLLMLAGMFAGYSWQLSLAAGMALSLSSTALVLQLLNEKNLMNTTVGETSFSVLLFQDIAIIPILILMPLLATQGVADNQLSTSVIDHLPAALQALAVAGAIGALILSGRYLAHYLFHMVAETNLREIFTALSLAVIIGVTLLMQLVGISPALGAFIAGMMFANSEYRRTLETDIEPFKGLLLGLFFISVGMGIDIALLSQEWMTVIAVVVGLLTIKIAVLYGIGYIFGTQKVHSIGYAIALSQSGEFAFVLLQLATNLSIMSTTEMKLLTLVVALSIATTPLLMVWYTRNIVPHFLTQLHAHPMDHIEEQNAIILAGFGRFGQVIGRFLTAQHVPVTVLENDASQIALLRKFGFKGYFGDATRLDLLRAAGADKAKILIITVDNTDTSLDIVTLAKQHFPHLTIFARARNRRHAYDLHKLGVTYFKRETFDSSLEMAKDIMTFLGSEAEDVAFKAEQFRRHDEATLKDSFQFFEDEQALITFSKTRRAEMERILQKDFSEHH
jgi:monovalent cation:proton antiporter-2 (CPA2) family protein